MKTSHFKEYKGPGRVVIARYAPRGTPAGYRIYKALAPTKEMLKMEIGPYREKYFGEILAALNPFSVWMELHSLANGHEPVLMCWEDISEPGAWCHRRMVAEWLKEKTGEDVHELSMPLSENLQLNI